MPHLVLTSVHYTLLAHLPTVLELVGHFEPNSRVDRGEQDVVQVATNPQVLNDFGKDLAHFLSFKPSSSEVLALEHPDIDGCHFDLGLSVVFPLGQIVLVLIVFLQCLPLDSCECRLGFLLVYYGLLL